jgi:hypothetical protein
MTNYGIFSWRLGKRAYKVGGSVRLLLPLHEVARKGLSLLPVCFLLFTISVFIQQTEGMAFDHG